MKPLLFCPLLWQKSYMITFWALLSWNIAQRTWFVDTRDGLSEIARMDDTKRFFPVTKSSGNM